MVMILLSTHADRQGVDISFTVCLFVRLRISPARIKLAASNFSRWFMGVSGRESPTLGNFASPEVQNRTNRPARIVVCRHTSCSSLHMRLSWNRAVCGRRIGMCGYTAVPEARHLPRGLHDMVRTPSMFCCGCIHWIRTCCYRLARVLLLLCYCILESYFLLYDFNKCVT